MGRRIPFAFLEDIKGRFLGSYGGEPGQSAVAYQLDAAFKPYLRDRMAFFSNDKSADTINRLRGEVTEVKKITLENIGKVCTGDLPAECISHSIAWPELLDTAGKPRQSCNLDESLLHQSAGSNHCRLMRQQQQQQWRPWTQKACNADPRSWGAPGAASEQD